MKAIDSKSLVDLVFHLDWSCPRAQHSECFQASGVNMWRDLLPQRLCDTLAGRMTGDRMDFSVGPGRLVPGYDPAMLFEVPRKQFVPDHRGQSVAQPRRGRFYPKGVLSGISGIFKENIEPFRCTDVDNGRIGVNFNHPLAECRLDLTATVGRVRPKASERGGSCTDWMESLTSGPGMQMRWRQQPTDYFSDRPFERSDSRPDKVFYERPRMTRHLDNMASDVVRSVYARFLTSGMRVLDLMSSCHSNVPGGLDLERFEGLGMNAAEMRANPHLSGFTVHDLNRDSILPYGSQVFDAVLCSVSVEYLTDPVAVFREVGRVLRPGGFLGVTFSNRWFPPKVTRIWTELHEFERIGLVLELFIRAGLFDRLHTYSVRGLPRPQEDRYYPQMRFADPVYAVWGQRI
jgi:FKBP-type peptidyl-prolyl cis-trans isomerase 2